MEKYTGLIVAKLAKEKGFDEYCYSWFITLKKGTILESIRDKFPQRRFMGYSMLEEDVTVEMIGGEHGKTISTKFKNNESKDIVARPTQSQLHNWLMELFKINVNIKHIPHNQKYGYTITGSYHAGVNGVLKSYDFKSFETHQEAFEDGLEEALKLIKL